MHRPAYHDNDWECDDDGDELPFLGANGFTTLTNNASTTVTPAAKKKTLWDDFVVLWTRFLEWLKSIWGRIFGGSKN